MAVTTTELPAWITREVALLAFLGVAVFGQLAYLYWAGQQNHLIRLSDLMTGDNGRLASNKTFQFLAFCASSWAMVFFTATGKADMMGWAAWTAIWSGAALTNKAIANNANAKAQELAAAAGAPPPIPPARD